MGKKNEAIKIVKAVIWKVRDMHKYYPKVKRVLEQRGNVYLCYKGDGWEIERIGFENFISPFERTERVEVKKSGIAYFPAFPVGDETVTKFKSYEEILNDIPEELIKTFSDDEKLDEIVAKVRGMYKYLDKIKPLLVEGEISAVLWEQPDGDLKVLNIKFIKGGESLTVGLKGIVFSPGSGSGNETIIEYESFEELLAM